MGKNLKKYKASKNTLANGTKAVSRLLEKLKSVYPDAHCALNHKNPLQLLVATILSAQCTDKRVNMVTPALFKKYPDARALAEADLDELMLMIRSTGFFRNKAKNIKACCQKIVSDYSGRVPDEMQQLITLPGVARKTANVVLWTAFGKNEGVTVDTHVLRISKRLGLTKSDKPGQVERDLMKLLPTRQWGIFSHLLIDLGRDVCKAPKPFCQDCRINSICPWPYKHAGSRPPRKRK